MKIGVIGLSFALRPGREPNPCNVRLAREFERVVVLERSEGHEVLGSLQWEIAWAPMSQRIRKENVVCVVEKHRDSESRLDSDEVILQSMKAFESRRGVDEVVIVANPWIHLQGARFRARSYGLKVRKRRIRWIGFDTRSSQWQTKGPIRAFVYTVGRVIGQIFFGRRFGQEVT